LFLNSERGREGARPPQTAPGILFGGGVSQGGREAKEETGWLPRLSNSEERKEGGLDRGGGVAVCWVMTLSKTVGYNMPFVHGEEKNGRGLKCEQLTSGVLGGKQYGREGTALVENYHWFTQVSWTSKIR